MRANLFINYYIDKNTVRQKELETCVLANMFNREINSITIFVDEDHRGKLEAFMLMHGVSKLPIQVHIKNFIGRPTFNDYFRLTKEYKEDLNIISNKDIIMDVASIRRLKEWNWRNYCIALCKYDIIDNNLDIEKAVHYNHADSQDTYILKGAFPTLFGVDFGLGIAGNDNSLCYHLSQKFDVINPSLDIKSYHYHLSDVRNYVDRVGRVIERIPPPYLTIAPSFLPE